MRLSAALISLTLALVAARDPHLEHQPEPYGIIQDLINKFLEGIKGSKEEFIPNVSLGEGGSLSGILIASEVGDYVFDMEDKLSKFEIRNLTIPVNLLYVVGQYRLDDLDIGGLVLYGNGDFRISLENLNVFLSMSANYKSSTGKYTVTDIAIDTSVEQSMIRFENLMNGEPMGEFLNFMVDELAKTIVQLAGSLVQQYKVDIMKELSKILSGLMNNNNDISLSPYIFGMYNRISSDIADILLKGKNDHH